MIFDGGKIGNESAIQNSFMKLGFNSLPIASVKQLSFLLLKMMPDGPGRELEMRLFL